MLALGLAAIAAPGGPAAAVTFYPAATATTHYSIIPPLGNVRSIAASQTDLYALSDNFILVYDKQALTLKRTFAFTAGDNPSLLAFDQWFGDVWILAGDRLMRLNAASGTGREYPIPGGVRAIGIGIEAIYLDRGGVKVQMNRATGEIKAAGSLPENLKWFRNTSEKDLRKYPLLTPFFYTDELASSQRPFTQYAITTLYDDGMDIYVGTAGYGLLKYNAVSGEKKRIVYGPLPGRIVDARRSDAGIFFISTEGISVLAGDGGGTWSYTRLMHEITNLVRAGDRIIVSAGQGLSFLAGTLTFPLANFEDDILALTTDGQSIYVGTVNGMFRRFMDGEDFFEFGPDRYPVYAIQATDASVLVGAETGLFRYEKTGEQWSRLLNRGVKDIVRIKDEYYLLGLDNQLIRYREAGSDSAGGEEPGWLLLPYFNIYDIDTDSAVLYCASYSGAAYYDPAVKAYRVIYNLPTIKYSRVFVVDSTLVAVSEPGIFRLPIKYRN